MPTREVWWKQHVQEFPRLSRMIDVIWDKRDKHPEINLKESNWNDTHTQIHRDIHTLTIVSLTHTCRCHRHLPAYTSWLVHLHDLIP
jgi:hypothetical protein